jgi:uncharacterized protein (TIGR03083 family)
VRRESDRFLDIIRTTSLTQPVPSCPGWSLADLCWHLSEVQQFWASIVADLLPDPEAVVKVSRPADTELPDLFAAQSQHLIEVLRRRDPADVCWSWHDGGSNVGWVRRRQAHEALIHRVDAELAAGTVSPFDPELAADGVAEILTVMLDATNIPAWSAFDRDGTTATVSLDDVPGTWHMELGRFRGTSPSSRISYNDAALRLLPTLDEPSVLIRGSAQSTDLWLWGRGPVEALAVTGDEAVAGHIRAAAADGTR